MWNQFSGHTASDDLAHVAIHPPHAPPEYLLRPKPNFYVQALQTAAPALAKIMQQRKQDEIANAVRSMSQQQAAGQTPTNPLQGQDYLTAQNLYAQQLAQQPDTATDDVKYNTDYANMVTAQNRAWGDDPNAPASDQDHGDKVLVTLPNGQSVYVTGNEAVRLQRPSKPIPNPATGLARDIKSTTGYTQADWKTATGITQNPDGSVDGVMPDGKPAHVGAATYQSWLQRAGVTPDSASAATPSTTTTASNDDAAAAAWAAANPDDPRAAAIKKRLGIP